VLSFSTNSANACHSQGNGTVNICADGGVFIDGVSIYNETEALNVKTENLKGSVSQHEDKILQLENTISEMQNEFEVLSQTVQNLQGGVSFVPVTASTSFDDGNVTTTVANCVENSNIDKTLPLVDSNSLHESKAKSPAWGQVKTVVNAHGVAGYVKHEAGIYDDDFEDGLENDTSVLANDSQTMVDKVMKKAVATATIEDEPSFEQQQHLGTEDGGVFIDGVSIYNETEALNVKTENLEGSVSHGQTIVDKLMKNAGTWRQEKTVANVHGVAGFVKPEAEMHGDGFGDATQNEHTIQNVNTAASGMVSVSTKSTSTAGEIPVTLAKLQQQQAQHVLSNNVRSSHHEESKLLVNDDRTVVEKLAISAAATAIIESPHQVHPQQNVGATDNTDKTQPLVDSNSLHEPKAKSPAWAQVKTFANARGVVEYAKHEAGIYDDDFEDALENDTSVLTNYGQTMVHKFMKNADTAVIIEDEPSFEQQHHLGATDNTDKTRPLVDSNSLVTHVTPDEHPRKLLFHTTPERYVSVFHHVWSFCSLPYCSNSGPCTSRHIILNCHFIQHYSFKF
jgi:hypothetical protein